MVQPICPLAAGEAFTEEQSRPLGPGEFGVADLNRSIGGVAFGAGLSAVKEPELDLVRAMASSAKPVWAALTWFSPGPWHRSQPMP